MALWVQAAALLVGVTLSVTGATPCLPNTCVALTWWMHFTWCAVTRASSTTPNPKNERWTPLQGFLPPKAGQENEVAEYPYKDMGEAIVKRGIVEQCCHQPCNILELQSYCSSFRS